MSHDSDSPKALSLAVSISARRKHWDQQTCVAALLFTGSVTVRRNNEYVLIMSRGREVIDRKYRNNSVINKTTPSEKKIERGTDSLLVVRDEMNKEQDNLFFRLGRIEFYALNENNAPLSHPSSFHPVLSRFNPNQVADL